MASEFKIDRVETSFTTAEVENPFTTLVFATERETLEAVVFTVVYSDPDGLEAAILASPTVDGGTIVDFL